jgi:hypothetical protein
MSPLWIDIEVPRDGHYFEGWHLRDKDGVDIDLTGHTLSAVAQKAAGTDPVIAAADIDVYDPVHGRLNMKWTGADFSGVAGNTEIVRLSWKLRDTAPDGVGKDIARGEIILIPENS